MSHHDSSHRRSPHWVAPLLLLAATATMHAQIVTQLTNIKDDQSPVLVSLDDAGNFVYGNSTTNQFGGNPSLKPQIFRWNAASSGGNQVTNFDGTHSIASVSDDGTWLAFTSDGDPLGTNPDRSAEVFVMRTDGTAVAQLTSDPSPVAGSAVYAVISGDASRVIFGSNSNYLGTNPQNRLQLFVVQRDGTGLRQLTSDSTGLGPFFIGWRISDNGLRVSFESRANPTGGNADGSSEIFAINADGTGLRQLTSSLKDSEQPLLSGDGSAIAFISNADLVPGSNLFGVRALFTINWDGTSLKQATSAFTQVDFATIVDDGNTLYFSSPFAGSSNPDGSEEVFRVAKNGTGLTQVTSTTTGTNFLVPEISGSGNRLAIYAIGPAPPWGSGRATDPQIHSMTSTGASPRQLTNALSPVIRGADANGSGSFIYFGSDENLGGLNPSRAAQLWKIGSNGSGVAKLVQTNDVPAQTSVTTNGETIVFSAKPDPLSSDPILRTQQIYSVAGDGTGLRRLTNGDAETSAPAIARNGSVIAFISYDDLDGSEGASFNPDLFTIKPNGTSLRRITTTGSGSSFDTLGSPSVDGSGTWVVFASNLNLTAQNADGSREIYRVHPDGSGMQQLTNAPADGNSDEPDISGDGRYVVFHSTADFLGTNPEKNGEVFVLDTTTSLLRQLTAYSSGEVVYTVVSEDGQWAFFRSSAPVFESDPDRPSDGYRVRLSDGWIQRMGGLHLYGGGAFSFMDLAPAPSDDGQRVAVVTYGDVAQQNPDQQDELFLIDFTRAPVLNVSKSTPTAFSWTPEPSPVRYDVLRGFVASLRPGAGGTVDLGPVVCLENDSPDPSIIGHEDPVTPAPGQAFFYLYRGSQGLIDGPGSWGKSTTGAERQPSTGSCAN